MSKSIDEIMAEILEKITSGTDKDMYIKSGYNKTSIDKKLKQIPGSIMEKAIGLESIFTGRIEALMTELQEEINMGKIDNEVALERLKSAASEMKENLLQ